MCGYQLNEEAAVLMGWKQKDTGKYEAYGWIDNNGNDRIIPPDYCSTISSAWELIEYNPEWRWSIYQADGHGWIASPMEACGFNCESSLWRHVAEATEETAPLAITKAFIKAMEEK